jgi:hypothetical protein
MREKDVANREKLYSEFLTEVADLYVDSLNRTLDDVGKPAAFVAAYGSVAARAGQLHCFMLGLFSAVTV